MKVNINKIAFELNHLGWSIPTLAKKADMPRQTIYLIYQKETASLKSLSKIAKAMALDPKDLLI